MDLSTGRVLRRCAHACAILRVDFAVERIARAPTSEEDFA